MGNSNSATRTSDLISDSTMSMTPLNSFSETALYNSHPRSEALKIGSLDQFCSDQNIEQLSTVEQQTIVSNKAKIESITSLPSLQSECINLSEILSENRIHNEKTENLVDNLTNTLLSQFVSDTIDDALVIWKSKQGSILKHDDVNTNEDEDISDEIPAEYIESESEDSSSETVSTLDLNSDLTKGPSNEGLDGDFPELPKSRVCVTPEVLYSSDTVKGLFANVPDRATLLIRSAVKYLWDSRSQATLGNREAALRLASSMPPTEFSSDFFDQSDIDSSILNDPSIRFFSRPLLFDLVVEVMQKVYDGEDSQYESEQKSKRPPRISSAQFRLWRGPYRPSTFSQLLNIINSEVQLELGLKINSKSDTYHETGQLKFKNNDIKEHLNRSRFSRLAQWTLGKKSWLDRILELELRSDEASWLSYVPEERELKSKLAEQLWDELFNDTIMSILSINKNKKNHNPN